MSAIELMDKSMDCGMDHSWRVSIKERLASGVFCSESVSQVHVLMFVQVTFEFACLRWRQLPL